MALAKYSNFLSNVESVTRCTKELFSDSNLHFLSKTFQQCSILSSLMLLSLMGTSMKSLEADDDEDELESEERALADELIDDLLPPEFDWRGVVRRHPIPALLDALEPLHSSVMVPLNR